MKTAKRAAPAALPPGFDYRDGRLCLDGAPLEAAAAEFGTPAYVYSAAQIRDRMKRLRSAFHGRGETLLCYAFKANPSLALGRLLASEGAGVEVVSGGELFLARKAGFPSHKILFSGVGKTPQEMREALRRQILLFNVESSGELELLEQEAARSGVRAPVSIRVNPDIDAGTHKHITTGRAGNKFGLPPEQALQAYRKAAVSPYLEASGLHVHLGSQILSATPYKRSAALLARLAGLLAREGLHPRFLDAGGGFGLSYGKGKGLAPEAVAQALRPLRGSKRTLIVEPGRYLVAEAGALLTRILYVKKSGGRTLAVLDTGMSELIRPALYGAHHPLVPLTRKAGGDRPVEAVGPLCESSDTFGVHRLPDPQPGDLCALLWAGAYGFSMSSTYNGRPRPPEVLLDGGRWSVIRRRETYQDLCRQER